MKKFELGNNSGRVRKTLNLNLFHVNFFKGEYANMIQIRVNISIYINNNIGSVEWGSVTGRGSIIMCLNSKIILINIT